MNFDGEEKNYEQWELKLLAYMKIRKLKNVINPDSTSIHSMDEKEEAFAELIQFLDERDRWTWSEMQSVMIDQSTLT